MAEQNLLSSITDQKRAEIHRKNWMSLDARWQMAVFQECGIELGNKLNKTVIQEMGKVMMYRLMGATEISEVSNISELEAICSAAMELYYPPPAIKFHFEQQSDTSLLGVIEYCITNENVKKVGMSEYYECGCFAMRSGWYEALGVNAEEKLGKCLKSGDEVCEISINVSDWKTQG